MKRFSAGILAVIFILNISLTVFAFPDVTESKRVLTPPIWMPYDLLIDNENIPLAKDDIMRPVQDMGFFEVYGNAQKFTNLVDGYSVIVPADMKLDFSLSDICATLTDSHRQLRIFKESFSTISEKLAYLGYSNKFIENTTDHTLIDKKTFSDNGYDYQVLEWSRSKLSKVKKDKNYYACVDVCKNARVYTFYFTADVPFSSCGGYIDIVKSLVTFDPSVPEMNAYNKGYKASGQSHMNASTKNAYNNLFSDDTSFKMGMFSPPLYGGNEKLEEFEDKIGYEFASLLLYSEFTDHVGIPESVYNTRLTNAVKSLEDTLEYCRKNSMIPELTLQTPLTRSTKANMVYEILNGEFEGFLKRYTQTIAKYSDVPVLFRPFNEMNGDWCTYSAYHTSRDTGLYVELYKYLYNSFKQAGCTNVIWVWNPNERSFPNYKWNNQSLYYPGDEYVDVYGITGYNNGTYYEGETWRSFDEIYSTIYEQALRINEKPMMITEFACSSIGGDKVSWLEDMFLSLPKYDKIKMAIWWHAADFNGEELARPYFMDTPDGMLEVFDKYLN